MAFEAGLAKLSFIARDCQAKAVLSTKQLEYDYRLMLGYLTRRAALGGHRAAPGAALVRDGWQQEFGGAPVADTPGPVMFLQYTSGSTSDPKGVIVSHANVIANARSLHRRRGGGQLAPAAPRHGLDLRLLVRVSASARPRMGCHRRTSSSGHRPGSGSSARCAQPTHQRRTSRSSTALREDKLPASELAGIDLSSLESMVIGAEPLRAKTFTRFRQRFAPYGLRPDALGGAYGLAENTLVVSLRGRQILAFNKRALQKNVARVEKALPENNNQTPLVSCGKPIAGNVVRIVDPESRQALGEGRVGEIWVDGAIQGRRLLAPPRTHRGDIRGPHRGR